MDPLSFINKVFALISQEEHQCRVGFTITIGSEVSGSSSSMAFAAKVAMPNSSNKFFVYFSCGQKNNNLHCTHYKFHGHITVCCFKLHGYLLEYKPKFRDNATSANLVNQPLK